MATNSVEYLSCSRLCCGDLPAPIFLCIPTELVEPHLCPSTYGYSGSGGGGDPMPFDFSFIEGEIGTETEVKGRCNTSTWRYIFTFDDAQLISGAVLSGTDISGIFCQGCFTDWIQQLIGNEPYIVSEDNGTQTFVSPHGCEYPIVTGIVEISDEPGNLLVELEDGLYACQLAVEDTDSVDLTLTEGDNECQTLTADVQLSAAEDNQITIEADGLYVPESPAQTTLSVTDTETVNLTIGGTLPQTLSADVKISATGGNIITEEADGLYATASGGSGKYLPLSVETDPVTLPSSYCVEGSTTETDMMTYTVPAGTLTASYDRIKFKGMGVCETQSGDDYGTIRVYMGAEAAVFHIQGVQEPNNGLYWVVEGEIIRSNYLPEGRAIVGVTCSNTVTLPSAAVDHSNAYSAIILYDFSDTFEIRFTGQLVTPPDFNSICQFGLIVDKVLAP